MYTVDIGACRVKAVMHSIAVTSNLANKIMYIYART